MNFGLPPGKEPDEVEVSDRLGNKGMPIGNLTSQMFANIYLNEVDQYAKHELGLHYYIRYMDDIIILHHDKKYLAEVKELLSTFLADELRLDLNNKTAIRPCSMGVDFVGFRIWATHRRLKKKTAVKIKRNLKRQIVKVKAGEERKDRLDRSVASYRGILSHCDSYGLRQSLNTMFKENGMVEKKQRKEITDNVYWFSNNNYDCKRIRCVRCYWCGCIQNYQMVSSTTETDSRH